MTRTSRPERQRGPRPSSVTIRPAGCAGTHRRRVRARLATRGRLRAPRPLTVWPCADDHHPAGTGLLAQWLHTAVIRIVTGYTRPGDRVLLLAPHAVPAESTAGWPGTVSYDTAPATTMPSTGGRPHSRPGPLSGLHEAGWTVVRLGRDVVTRTVTSHPGPLVPAVAPTPDVVPQSETRPGPAGGPAPDAGEQSKPHPDPVAHAATRPRTDPAGGLADHFDAIIAAVDPFGTDWLDTLDWPALLTPHGIVAVITHCDTNGGRLVDPVGPVTTALRGRRLAYHDHVVLLEVPLSEISAGRAPGAADSSPTRDAVVRLGRDGAVASARTHADLLIFTRSSAPTAVPAKPTSLGEASDV